MAKFIYLSIFIFLCISVKAQDMYLQNMNYHNKWRSTVGVGAAEPIAIHAQFYKGFSCKGLRSWLIEAQVGVEGLIYNTADRTYMSGTWEQGALRYSLAYNRRILRAVTDYIPWIGFLGGLGIQAGNRNYLDEAGLKKSAYSAGPMANFNFETYLVDKRISKNQYLGIIAYAEYIYHRELEGNFYISRVNGGIRLNFYN